MFVFVCWQVHTQALHHRLHPARSARPARPRSTVISSTDTFPTEQSPTASCRTVLYPTACYQTERFPVASWPANSIPTESHCTGCDTWNPYRRKCEMRVTTLVTRGRPTRWFFFFCPTSINGFVLRALRVCTSLNEDGFTNSAI